MCLYYNGNTKIKQNLHVLVLDVKGTLCGSTLNVKNTVTLASDLTVGVYNTVRW